MTTPSSTRQEVTQLLGEWSGGDDGALEKLVPLVQPELHRLAHHYSFCNEITAFLTFAACPEGRRLTIFRVH
jgi:hypothetical protein